MDTATEDGEGWWQQRWRLTAAAAGGNGRQLCLKAAMGNGEGVAVTDEDKTAKGSGGEDGV
jgi:hypothetical protein